MQVGNTSGVITAAHYSSASSAPSVIVMDAQGESLPMVKQDGFYKDPNSKFSGINIFIGRISRWEDDT